MCGGRGQLSGIRYSIPSLLVPGMNSCHKACAASVFTPPPPPSHLTHFLFFTILALQFSNLAEVP